MSEKWIIFVVNYAQPAIRTKNWSKSASAIKVATMKNTDSFYYGKKPYNCRIDTFTISKGEQDTKRTQVCSWRYVVYYGMPKGTCWAEAMSKIKPVALAVI